MDTTRAALANRQRHSRDRYATYAATIQAELIAAAELMEAAADDLDSRTPQGFGAGSRADAATRVRSNDLRRAAVDIAGLLAELRVPEPTDRPAEGRPGQ